MSALPTLPLRAADHELIERARALIRERYIENRHHIGCAVKTKSGKVFAGVHLDTYVGRASVCAEAIAVGMAMAAGERDLDTIVSVRHPRPREANRDIQIVSPCGICRELLADFAPATQVILPVDDGPVRVAIGDLLPAKYFRRP